MVKGAITIAVLTQNQLEFRERVREFAQKEIAPRAAEVDKTGEFPMDNVKKLADFGLMGLAVPQEYGGKGLDTKTYMLAVEEIGRACTTTGVILGVHASAGTLPILLFGTEQQKQKYVTQFAKGDKLAAFALTEPGAGSDASAAKTTAVLDGDCYVLNGTKCFITNGGPAEVYSVFAKTDPAAGVKGLTGFIVEKGTSGFEIGKHENKMGIRGSATVELIFRNVRLPKENVLGQLGKGFVIAMMVLDAARIGIAALAVGVAQGALDHAVNYAKERIQFGKPIASFQGISFKIANIASEIEAARQLVYHAAELKDAKLPYGREAAMAKYYATDVAARITRDVVDIFGGRGYLCDYPVERIMRDARVLPLVEGTNEIQRIVIAGHVLK